MSISVRKDAPTTPAVAPPTRRPLGTLDRADPFRVMRELMGYEPFEMAPFFARELSTFSPTFEVTETKDGFVFRADVPGVKESDLDVSLSGNRLTVAGKREAEKQEHVEAYYTYERTYGTFSRSFTLPDGVDASGISADLKDGVLTVSVKKLAEAQARKIAVQTGATKS